MQCQKADPNPFLSSILHLTRPSLMVTQHCLAQHHQQAAPGRHLAIIISTGTLPMLRSGWFGCDLYSV